MQATIPIFLYIHLLFCWSVNNNIDNAKQLGSLSYKAFCTYHSLLILNLSCQQLMRLARQISTFYKGKYIKFKKTNELHNHTETLKGSAASAAHMTG